MSGAQTWLAVAAGGALGAALRSGIHHGVARLARRHARSVGPALATLVANGLGCIALAAWLASGEAGAAGRSRGLEAFVAIGVCGGLTTFSTLCADLVRLAGVDRRAGIAYLLATLAAGGGGWLLGLMLVR